MGNLRDVKRIGLFARQGAMLAKEDRKVESEAHYLPLRSPWRASRLCANGFHLPIFGAKEVSSRRT
jgi:hypothetical protein